MPHPTPEETRRAIFKALNEDEDRTGNDPHILPIPVRVYRIVDEAVAQAWQAKG